MDLLDRYLRDVRRHLPREQQDDIVRELSENLREQIDDREAELGRPLTDAETEALLRGHGHPAVVAGRYGGAQGRLVFGRQLVGPELFPFYARILAINLGITLVAFLGASIAFSGGRPFDELLPGAVVNLAIQFAVVTGIFVVAQRRVDAGWNPRPSRTPADASRPHLVFELFGLIVSAWWWLVMPGLLRVWFDPAASMLTGGLAWTRLYYGLLLLTVAQIPLTAIAIARPSARFRSVAKVAVHGAGAALAFSCVDAGSWLVANAPEYQRLARVVDRWGDAAAMWFGAISVFLCAVELWRLLRVPRGAAPIRAV